MTESPFPFNMQTANCNSTAKPHTCSANLSTIFTPRCRQYWSGPGSAAGKTQIRAHKVGVVLNSRWQHIIVPSSFRWYCRTYHWTYRITDIRAEGILIKAQAAVNIETNYDCFKLK